MRGPPETIISSTENVLRVVVINSLDASSRIKGSSLLSPSFNNSPGFQALQTRKSQNILRRVHYRCVAPESHSQARACSLSMYGAMDPPANAETAARAVTVNGQAL